MSSTTTWDSYLSPLWTPRHSASGSVRMAPWASQNARGRGCDLLVGPPRLRFLLRPEQGLYQGRCPVSPTASEGRDGFSRRELRKTNLLHAVTKCQSRICGRCRGTML